MGPRWLLCSIAKPLIGSKKCTFAQNCIHLEKYFLSVFRVWTTYSKLWSRDEATLSLTEQHCPESETFVQTIINGHVIQLSGE
jgi:hypothetical protein